MTGRGPRPGVEKCRNLPLPFGPIRRPRSDHNLREDSEPVPQGHGPIWRVPSHRRVGEEWRVHFETPFGSFGLSLWGALGVALGSTLGMVPGTNVEVI